MVGTYTEGDEPVPGFRLSQLLGWGRFGEVWKASGPGGITVAVKIIPLSNRQGLKEFRAIRLVKQIRHPNLVPIMAFWLKDRQGISSTIPWPTTPNLCTSSRRVADVMGLGEKAFTIAFWNVPGRPLRHSSRRAIDLHARRRRAVDYLNRRSTWSIPVQENSTAISSPTTF